MWKLQRHNRNESPDEKKIRSIGIWHFVLIAFIVIWMTGAYLYLNKKTEITMATPPVVVLDATDQIDITNFFRVSETQNQLYSPRNPNKPMFEVKEKYNLGDVVVVKYFYVEAVIIERSSTGDAYTIMYKDHNHTLQKISLPRTLLMYPAGGVLNPVSLLVD